MSQNDVDRRGGMSEAYITVRSPFYPFSLLQMTEFSNREVCWRVLLLPCAVDRPELEV